MTPSTAYQYNTLGQLTYVSESRGALNFATTYAWDKAGFLTGITLPSGRTISYTSNANGQVASVVGRVNGSNVTLASSITYYPFGPLNTMTYGNTRTFTDTYTTDNVGNITKAGTPTYGYDALLRLSSESGTTQYTYDATSNRATKVMGGTTTTTIPSTSNRISAVGANTITYDSSGNISSVAPQPTTSTGRAVFS